MWRKSSRSIDEGACVECAVSTNTTMVRDSKNPSGPTLRFPTGNWNRFLRTMDRA